MRPQGVHVHWEGPVWEALLFGMMIGVALGLVLGAVIGIFL